jgi:preprotein translocase subunit YajC
MTLASILAATSSTKSSSSSYFLLVLIVLFGAVYFLVLRPRQKKAQAAARQGKQFEVGDDVVTIGGVCGTVIAKEDDKVVLATGMMPGDDGSPGTVTHMTFLAQAIARKVEPEAPAPASSSTDVASPEADANGNDEKPGGTSS